ncbi:acetylornithine transaminase [Limosilactobacillus mucosae]|uniref:acetylornithine transaminase n=1 Tax=Limosilactobacillus mucosae TaxID=97478 RepID=UPI00233EC2EB|nr:acetylornithine transaminase [Limosilactobacillus mucosae]MDC2845154.1 acetylornithine transaminase [Limosilactobacillus mucosae]
MNHLFPTYTRFPFEIVKGQGTHLFDEKGNEYLDLTSGIGVCGLGYNVKELNDAVEQQLHQVWHTSNLYESSLQENVAAKLGIDMLVSFANSGTEANEAALKLARKATGRLDFLAFDHSFHGRSAGSLTVTGNQDIKEGFLPLVPGARFAKYNDYAALDEIKPDLAGVILEVVQGEGGVIAGDAKWLKAVEEKCHEVGALLLIDEVQTGMGRTGSLFAFEQFGLHPDIYTVAKGLANGIPVGAMVGKKELGQYFGPGSHGSTFAGNPLAMAAAQQVLKTLDEEFLKTVQQKAAAMHQAMEKELLSLDMVDSISGLGLMIGIHLDQSVPVGQVLDQLHAQRVLALSARDNTLRLLPPLIASQDELLTGVDEIKKALNAVELTTATA